MCTEWTGCAVTTKGSYVLPGRKPGVGERKLRDFAAPFLSSIAQWRSGRAR